MILKYKPEFKSTKKYWEAFWNKEIIDRPVVMVTSPLEGVEQKPHPDYMSGSDGNFDYALKSFEDWAATTFFGGEAIPIFEPSFGPDQFSAFLGAELDFTASKRTSWVHPFVKDWEDVNLTLDESNPNWVKMVNFMTYAGKYSEGKFLISSIDCHSNMDCLRAIRGTENLCMDICDNPNEIERALKQTRALYSPIYEKLYEVGNMKRGTSAWIPFYCEGRFSAIQCDFQCMLSPEDGLRFVIPALEEEASYLDHCIFHYDGKEALRHLDNILAIKEIDAIQWGPGAGQPRTVEWMDLLKKIQSAGKGLWLYDWTTDEIKNYYKELKPAGLAFSINVNSQKEAEDLLEWFRVNT